MGVKKGSKGQLVVHHAEELRQAAQFKQAVAYCRANNRKGKAALSGGLQWSECWDLNDLGSLRGGRGGVSQKPGFLVLLYHF